MLLLHSWKRNNHMRSNIENSYIALKSNFVQQNPYTCLRLHDIHLEFSAYPHIFKWLLWSEIPVYKDFWCTNINNHQICFHKHKKYVKICIKGKNSPQPTWISSLKYMFIIFFETNQMLKYTYQSNKPLYDDYTQ